MKKYFLLPAFIVCSFLNSSLTMSDLVGKWECYAADYSQSFYKVKDDFRKSFKSTIEIFEDGKMTRTENNKTIVGEVKFIKDKYVEFSFNGENPQRAKIDKKSNDLYKKSEKVDFRYMIEMPCKDMGGADLTMPINCYFSKVE